MKKPNKSKQQRDLSRGKKKAAKELVKKKKRNLKKRIRLAENTEEKKMKRETFKLEDEVRRIQNRGLTVRKNKEKPIDK